MLRQNGVAMPAAPGAHTTAHCCVEPKDAGMSATYQTSTIRPSAPLKHTPVLGLQPNLAVSVQVGGSFAQESE